jgi:alpha-tubulin suppressor-like RCC1 family protein
MYGDKLALSGNSQFVIIGARGGVGNENGRAEIYTYNAATWQQVDSDIIGEGQDDLFGQAVAINETGTVIAIGGSANDGGGADAGNVRTFTQACSPPAAPTGTVSQAFCSGATLAQVVASGTEVKWYNATVGGTLLPNTTILTNGTVYYASQTISDCESTDRLAVTVTLNTIAAPTGSTSQEFCNGATIANLVVTGTDIIWYDAATGGTALNSTDNLTNGTLYYASQTVGGCESTSLAVTATVNTTPAPTAKGQVFCNQATVANLVATGTNIKWYTAATGGIPLSESVELATNVALTFYASQTLNGCESTERTAVFAVVYLITAPTAEATQVLCSTSTIADLAATLMEGAEILWYAAATGGTALESTTPLVDGTTYYAEQLFSAFCPSTNRTAVSVELLPVPSAPVSDVTQPTCVLATGSISITTQQAGEAYSFNNGEAYQNGNSISGLTAGEYKVVIRSSDGCVSPATAVTINAQPTPTTPVVTITQPTCASNTGTVTVTIQNAGDTYSFDNGNNYQSSNAKSGLATGDYNVIIKSTEGCTSPVTLATVDAAPSIPNAPTGNTEQAFCSAATVAQLTATGTAIQWYATETGGTPLATTTALTNNTTYYASQTVGCESTSRLAVVTVNTITVPTGEATQTFCTSEATVAELTATAPETISWYTTPTGGTPLAFSQVLTKGTYYAGYSKNGCESARLAVVVDYAFFWNTISAGSSHTLGIERDGKLWAWGYNADGQLGDGTYTGRNSPVQIGSDKWTRISAGNFYTLGIKQDGTLWAWGFNADGQLGDGTNSYRNTPVQIGTGKWISVTAGYAHTLGIKQDGTLWAWGFNADGQLGDGTNTNRNTPVQIGTGKWISITTGDFHTLGIKQDSTLWAWGDNFYGQLGDGTNTNRNTPVQIGNDKWSSITCGSNHTLAIKQEGTLWAWGQNNTGPGQLGDGTNTNRNAPVQIGADKWISITTGYLHTLGIKQEGTLWAWGRNDFGQLGDGSYANRNTPAQIGSDKWTSITAGVGHTLGIKQEGTLWAWGRNNFGQLGDGTAIRKNTPVRLGVAPPVLPQPTLTVDFTNESEPLLTTSGGSEFVWHKNRNVIEGANESTYSVPSEGGEGLYTVATIGTGGCQSPLSNEIPIYITALDFEPEASIQLYPNPAQESLLVKVEAQVQLSVVSINGHVQNVSTEWLSNEQAHRVHIKDLISGMYILQIQQNGKRAQVKFIKQ